MTGNTACGHSVKKLWDDGDFGFRYCTFSLLVRYLNDERFANIGGLVPP
jgi:hypothetical protein